MATITRGPLVLVLAPAVLGVVLSSANKPVSRNPAPARQPSPPQHKGRKP